MHRQDACTVIFFDTGQWDSRAVNAHGGVKMGPSGVTSCPPNHLGNYYLGITGYPARSTECTKFESAKRVSSELPAIIYSRFRVLPFIPHLDNRLQLVAWSWHGMHGHAWS